MALIDSSHPGQAGRLPRASVRDYPAVSCRTPHAPGRGGADCAERAGHHVHLDDPELVTGAVIALLHRARQAGPN